MGTSQGTMAGSHHSDEDEQVSPARPPVRPVERSDLEQSIVNVVEKELEAMHEGLREDQRVQEDVTMNETEKLRLALKYKYKYKYKYEVTKSQDRSTPLLGDSWDLDPALQALKMSEFQGSDSQPQEDFTLDEASNLFRSCKMELDAIWKQMVTPPPQAASLSKRDLQETMREQRQALLPQEKSAKKMCDHLKGLIRVFQDAQKDKPGSDEPSSAQSFSFRLSTDDFTLDAAEDLFKACKRELDTIWRKMVTPPPQAASLSKRDLRETMREQRQALLPQEKSAKKTCDHLKGLIRVFQDAQKADLSASAGDNNNAQTLQGTETSEEKLHRGNERVQTALKDLNVHMITHESLLHETGEEASLVKQLRHELRMGAATNSEPSSPETEKQG